jgi:hypothetical protein
LNLEEVNPDLSRNFLSDIFLHQATPGLPVIQKPNADRQNIPEALESLPVNNQIAVFFVAKILFCFSRK